MPCFKSQPYGLAVTSGFFLSYQQLSAWLCNEPVNHRWSDRITIIILKVNPEYIIVWGQMNGNKRLLIFFISSMRASMTYCRYTAPILDSGKGEGGYTDECREARK